MKENLLKKLKFETEQVEKELEDIKTQLSIINNKNE